MDFIFKSISSFQLPYTLDGNPAVKTPFGTLENAVRKSDSLQISVHTYDTNALPASLLKNHIHKSKILRLPGLVKVLEVIESSPEKVYVITERVTPLKNFDYKQLNKDSLELGIYQISQTLDVLHEQAKCVFGALCLGNVYINKKGEWLLYGMELTTNLKDTNSFASALSTYSGVARNNDDWFLGDGTATTIDMIQLSRLIKVVLQGRLNSSWNQLSTSLSKGQSSSIKKLISHVSNNDQNPLISVYDHLKEIHIKDTADKIMVLSNIQQKVSANESSFENCIPGFLEFSLLPELVQCTKMLSSTNQPTSTQVPFLATIFNLTCSERPAVNNSEIFASQIKPLLFQAFNIADRQVRFLLLLHFSNFMQKLTASEVADKIFPPFIQGLSDTDQVIRLQTLKNVSHLIGKITERQLNNDLLRVLAKTQVDKDIEIRTLTVLIITKIAHKLNRSNNRSTILATAFTKSLKDPELKPRLATLYGLEITLDLFDAETIAQRILTVIGPGLLDKNSQVRTNAKNVFQLYWDKLEKESASIVEETDGNMIPTDEFERMMNDEEDGALINGFIQSVKVNTPTPMSTPAVLTETNVEVDPWDTTFDNEEFEDDWQTEQQTITKETEVKPFGYKVSVSKSWNADDLELESAEWENSRPLLNTKRTPLMSSGKPSILSKKPINKPSILNKPAATKRPSITTTTKKQTHKVISPASTSGLVDDSKDDDGWGDDW